MISLATSGQVISDRYRLEETGEQLPFSGTEVWQAVDTLLGTSVRIVLLDSTSAATPDVLDAARRAALFDDVHAIRVLSVSDALIDGTLGSRNDPPYICTELLPGESLARLMGKPLAPPQVHALVGEVSTTLARARENGLRHLALSPELIRIGSGGEVYVEGLGVAAPLSGIASDSIFGAEADRLEVRGVALVAADLLCGEESSTHDPHSTLQRALQVPDLPEALRTILTEEYEDASTVSDSPSTLVRALAPWPSVDRNQFVPSEPRGHRSLRHVHGGNQTHKDAANESSSAPSATADVQPSVDPELGIASAPPVSLHPQWIPVSAASAAEAVIPDNADHASDEMPATAAPPSGSEAEVSPSLDSESLDDPHEGARESDAPLAESTPAPDHGSENPVEPGSSGADSDSGEPEAIAAESETAILPNTPLSPEDASATVAPPPIARPASADIHNFAVPTPAPLDTRKPSVDETFATPPVPVVNQNRGHLYNSSVILVAVTAALVLVGGVWAASTFFSPTAPVELVAPIITATPTATGTGENPSTATTTSPSESTESLPAPTIASVTLLNPHADLLTTDETSEQDSPSLIPYAWDGDASTSWRSWWYSTQDFAGKGGVGLQITLAEKSKVNEVDITSNSTGGNVQWRIDASAAQPESGSVLAESAMSSSTVLSAGSTQATDTIILWFNQLPLDSDGKYRIDIAEIAVK